MYDTRTFHFAIMRKSNLKSEKFTENLDTEIKHIMQSH